MVNRPVDALPSFPNRTRIEELFEERGRRAELLAALVSAGGLPRDRAARVIQAELATLEAHAERVGLESLAQMAHGLRDLVGHLGGVAEAEVICRDVIVLDDNEVTRELLALAIQAEGHQVRVAGSVPELTALVRERRPDLLLTEAKIPGAPLDQFCGYLRRTMAMGSVPIVIFSSAQGLELQTLALNAGADLYLSKDQGINELTRELSRLFEEIIF
jgi:CheY-like chemotaxis protein